MGNAELFRICARFTETSGREEAGGAESVLQATRITLGLLASRIGLWGSRTRPGSMTSSDGWNRYTFRE
jgi:hypothetical protein